MKKLLFAIFAFATASGAVAQNRLFTSEGAEAPRRQLRPFATVDEAAADVREPSRYIVPLTEWTREERDGTVRFTAEFVYPAAWLNRQILLRTESASSGFGVEVEGVSGGHVTNGAVPAEFNITRLAQPGINRVTVVLDSRQSNEPLLRDGVAWLGRTEIVCQPTIRIRDFDTRTTLNDSGNGVFEVAIAVKSDALNDKRARISYELSDSVNLIAAGYKDVVLSMRGEDTVRFVTIVPDSLLWSPEHPSLLRLTLRNRIDGRYAENMVVPVGVREVKYADNRLIVNGRPVSMKVRSVLPNISVEELRQMKERGFDGVTVEAGDAVAGLCEACDSAGVYVIAQLAADTSNGGRSIKRGGNASNDPSLTAEFRSRTASMFHTVKSHPSVVAYSLGNGITNGINPYESYLLLKRLDSARPIIYNGAGKEWNNDTFEMRN